MFFLLYQNVLENNYYIYAEKRSTVYPDRVLLEQKLIFVLYLLLLALHLY